MTQFVPLAGDVKGTLSAVTIGDWVLQVIKAARPNETATFYADFVKNFTLDEETGNQQLADAVNLFKLLANQAKLILDVLADAKERGEGEVVQSVVQNGVTKETRMTKTYAELNCETEEFFAILLYLIVWRFEDVHEAGKAAGILCDILQNSHVLKEFRLTMLQTIYNAFPTTFTYRFPIFVAVLEYAAKTNQFSQLFPYIKNIEDWMADWGIQTAAKRNLYLIIATQLKKLGKIEQSYIYMKLHIETYQDEKPEVLNDPSVIGVVAELVEDTLRLPDVLYVDSIAELDAVKQLSTTQYGGLADLVNIFLIGNIDNLNTFLDLNPQLLEQHNLSREAITNKLLLLNLVTAITGHSSVNLTVLARTLNISQDETEQLAVTAVGRGLVDGRIDQLSNELFVTSVLPRCFTVNEWIALRQKISEKIAAIEELKKILKPAHAESCDKADRSKKPEVFAERKKTESKTSRPEDSHNWRA